MRFAQNGEWRLLFFVRLAIELSIAGSQAAVSFSGGLANVGVVVAVARDHLEEGRESAGAELKGDWENESQQQKQR